MTELTPVLNARLLRVPTIVFVTFSCLFAVLRSKNIFAVDGAHRCLQVWNRHEIFLDGTNHMLYPVNVFIWARLCALLGFKPDGPLQFFSMVELMNCLAGAACLAILCLLMYLVIPSWRLAVVLMVGYGFSKAFLEQATNANQPLVGVLFSFLGMVLASMNFKSKSNWPVVFSGFLFSLAMANYESTIFLAPAAILLIWRSRLQSFQRSIVSLPQGLAIGWFAASGIVSGALIFGLAYRYSGITDPVAMARRFLVIEGERAYAGQGFTHLLNVPVGMIRNIFPVLENYTGLRNLAAGSRLIFASSLLLLLCCCAFFFFCFAYLWKQRTGLSHSIQTGFLAASVGFVFTTIPLLLYDPHYDKLWLQPLACLAFLVFIALYVTGQETRKHFPVIKGLAILLLVGVLANSVRAIRGHFTPTVGMEQMQEMAETVGQQDFVVGGWDDLAILYSELRSYPGRYMDLFMEAGSYGRGATSHLRDAAQKTKERGGHFYFIGVLDVARNTWDSYLGSRCGLPFSDFDIYRSHSRVVTSYRVGSSEISLFQFDLNYLD
jgi:hypothetical protein